MCTSKTKGVLAAQDPKGFGAQCQAPRLECCSIRWIFGHGGSQQLFLAILCQIPAASREEWSLQREGLMSAGGNAAGGVSPPLPSASC